MIQPGQLVVLEAKTHPGHKAVLVNSRDNNIAAVPAKIVFQSWLGKGSGWWAILCKDHQGCVFIMRRRHEA